MSSESTTRPGSVPGPDPRLTPRQKVTLELLPKDRMNRQIASALTVREKTAENYARAVPRKLVTGLLAWVLEQARNGPAEEEVTKCSDG